MIQKDKIRRITKDLNMNLDKEELTEKQVEIVLNNYLKEEYNIDINNHEFTNGCEVGKEVILALIEKRILNPTNEIISFVKTERERLK